MASLWALGAAWPLAGLAAVPVAEVRVVEGAPTLFVHGQPTPPLLFYTAAPEAPVKVDAGRVTLERAAGEHLLPATVPAGSPLAVEVSVVLQEGFMDDATASDPELKPMTIVLVDPVVLDLDEDVPSVSIELGNPKYTV